MGMLWLCLLYLRAYISVAVVSRSSVGAEREIDVVTLALQPAVFIPRRAVPMRLAIDISDCTPRNILTVFSRSFSVA